MSLEFAIIPVTDEFLSAASTIQTKLKYNVNVNIIINIDTNYEQSLTSRINNWKKIGYDIITIDAEYYESNSIIVRFSDKGSRAQLMEVDEFIDLVSSFEDEHETAHNTDTDNEGGCILS